MHPDKNSSPDASMQFQRIAAAYQTLTDPVERRRFDADRAAAAELQKRQAEPVDLWTMMMQQHQQMHEQQHQLFGQFPFVASCPRGTRSSSTSTSARTYSEQDGTQVHVMQRTTVCDGVRTVTTETVRRLPDGRETRQRSERQDDLNETIDLTGGARSRTPWT